MKTGYASKNEPRRVLLLQAVVLTVATISLLSPTIDAFTLHTIAKNPTSIVAKSNRLPMVKIEYEYIPTNEGARLDFETDLASVYDIATTPSGMRGEAVRSAIRSGRCICWNLGGGSAPPSPLLQQGWIKVAGKGTMDFLNNKLSQTFAPSKDGGNYKEGCLLNAKGQVIDNIGVATLSSDCAYMLTSPGHAGSSLFQRMDPLIFPMDQVKLTDCSETSQIITLASTKEEHAEKVIAEYIVPLLKLKSTWDFPEQKCGQYELQNGAAITVLPTAVLPETALSGYTLILENDDDNLGSVLWNNLISEDSPNGPIEIGPLEFDTLRIEGGMPLFGQELTAADTEGKGRPAGPLELHCDALVDLSKGCYLGQEGVASVLKNKRGPPRQLYQVVFDYEGNVFDTESEGDRGNVENLTKIPVKGDELVVLGSQNEITVGTLTSVAEPSGTGDPTMYGLTLAKRADSILKAMKDRDLEIDRNAGKDPFADDPLWNGGTPEASAMMQPPPMDPLDGLEVLVKDTFTVGVLRSIPSRRYTMGQNMFTDIVTYEGADPGEGEVEVNRIRKRWSPQMEADIDQLFAKQQQSSGSAVVDAAIEEKDIDLEDADLMSETEQAELDSAMEEVAKAQADAEAAAAEAQRKTDKMAMLQKRAADAMARRKAQKKTEPAQTEVVAEAPVDDTDEEDAAEAEANRKAEKMAMLKKRADEALARRKAGKKKE